MNMVAASVIGHFTNITAMNSKVERLSVPEIPNLLEYHFCRVIDGRVCLHLGES